MGWSLGGNFDFLPGPCNITPQPEVIYCFRYLLSLGLDMPPDRMYAMMLALDVSRRKVGPILGRLGFEVTNHQFALALMTVAIEYHVWFSTDSVIEWLRSTLRESLKTPQSLRLEKSRRLPAIYWMMTLWACLTQAIDRGEEALRVLETTHKNILQ